MERLPRPGRRTEFSTGGQGAHLVRKDDGMRIAITKSVGGFFHEVLGEAVKTRQVEATDEAMSYLVALLTEFAHPGPVMGDAFDRPLAFLLDEAFRTTGA